MRCDVLVVGAGPAGASVARAAAGGGAEVLIVERRKAVGRPVRCAEFIPGMPGEGADFPSGCVAHEVKTMKVFLPGGEEFEFNSPGFILDRASFDGRLVQEALRRGARIMINTRCLRREGGKVILKKDGGEISVEARVIVGADGPRSTVGPWIRETNRDFVAALQYEMPLARAMDWTEVHFEEGLFGGYAWIFPKKKTANVGVGVKLRSGRRLSLRENLEAFVKRLSAEAKILPDPVAVTGGLIPVGGPLRTVKENIILVGDAAGHTHPITGAGIPQAVICGGIAGRAAAAAIGRNQTDLLSEYEDKWRARYDDEWQRGRRRRQLLESEWSSLGPAVKKCWVAFPEYYG